MKNNTKISDLNYYPKDEYTVIDYLKNHTSLAVTIVSSIIAVSTFLSYSAVYLAEKIKLDYWNCDTVYAKIEKGSLFATIVAIIISNLLFLFLGWIIGEIPATYRCFKSYCFYYEHILDSFQNNDNTAEYERISYIYKNMKSKFYKSFIIEGLINSIVCIIAVVLVYPYISKINWVFLLLTLAHILLFNVFLYLLSINDKYASIKDDEIEKISRIAERDIKEKSIDYVPKIRDLPWKGNFLSNPKKLLSNSSIKEYSCIFLVCFVSVFIITILSSSLSNIWQREFDVVSISDTTYVSIYNNGESIILEEANIEDDIITINTDKQNIISSYNVAFTKMKFEKVNKINYLNGATLDEASQDELK